MPQGMRSDKGRILKDLSLDFSAVERPCLWVSGSLQVQLDQGDLCQQDCFLGHLYRAVD